MRAGLRVQLLGLLGALMLLAFGPLYFSTATVARVGFEQKEREKGQKLTRQVATHVAELRERVSEVQLVESMSAQVQGGACQAIYLFGTDGAILARVGDPALMKILGPLGPEAIRARDVTWLKETSVDGPLVGALVPSRAGSVAALARLDPQSETAAPLTQLMRLYMIVSGLLVLVIAYFALTRWIVRPILALDRAAERVAEGGRALSEVPSGPAEIARLGESLRSMTRQLREEEDSLRRKIAEVEAATEKLRDAQSSLVKSERLATVGRLAAGLAHEIGNPISALMGFEDLLLEGGLTPEEERDFLERMRKETARIHRVLGDLLAYARPTNAVGHHAPSAPGSLSVAVDDVLSLLRPQKDFRDMQWSALVEESLPAVALGQEELTQCLLNLAMNAVDACGRRGHVTLTVRRLAASGGGDESIEVSVADDGPGVPPDVVDLLFEPFFSTKEVGKGTGLGLSVTRGLVEAARGSIHLDRSHAPGARFVVVLPVWTPEARSTSSSSVTV